MPASGLRKAHGLQGPIDDAFMDGFVFVRPTGKAFSARLGDWEREQADFAISEWIHFFRAEPRVKDDTDVTAADIAGSNLVLFGDPSSNAIYGGLRTVCQSSGARTASSLAKTSSLPATRRCSSSRIRSTRKKYVVINSGFTFHDQANNAMQSPKLPDWAVVDTTKPGNNFRYLPLFVDSQGFFDEAWRLKGPSRPTDVK